MAAHQPDILCLQETKAERGQIEIELPGYHEYWNSAVKKGYSGTAIFSRQEPLRRDQRLSRELCQALQIRGRTEARQRRQKAA